MLENHEQWFVNIDLKLNSHTEMIGGLAEDVSVLKTDVSVLKEDMSIVKTDICLIKGDLKQKVDYKEFTILERRVSAVEVS